MAYNMEKIKKRAEELGLELIDNAENPGVSLSDGTHVTWDEVIESFKEAFPLRKKDENEECKNKKR